MQWTVFDAKESVYCTMLVLQTVIIVLLAKFKRCLYIFHTTYENVSLFYNCKLFFVSNAFLQDRTVLSVNQQLARFVMKLVFNGHVLSLRFSIVSISCTNTFNPSSVPDLSILGRRAFNDATVSIIFLSRQTSIPTWSFFLIIYFNYPQHLKKIKTKQ